VLKRLNRAADAAEMELRHLCGPDQQQSLDNVLFDLYQASRDWAGAIALQERELAQNDTEVAEASQLVVSGSSSGSGSWPPRTYAPSSPLRTAAARRPGSSAMRLRRRCVCSVPSAAPPRGRSRRGGRPRTRRGGVRPMGSSIRSVSSSSTLAALRSGRWRPRRHHQRRQRPWYHWRLHQE
jgi:hypothetical protein